MTGSGRAGLAAAAVTVLAGTFLAGVANGGSPTALPPGPDPDPGPTNRPAVDVPIRLANADLTLPGECDALLDSYVERGVEQVGPYGWGPGTVITQLDGSLPFAAAEDASAAGSAPASGVVEQGSSATGTNVQEVGVDEPDVVKSDGDLLTRIDDGVLEVYDVTGSQPSQVAEVELPGQGTRELLLVDDTVVVTATGDQTRVTTYDVSDPVAPAVVDDRSITSGMVRAVQHGDTVRLVLSTGLPDLDFVQPRFWRDEKGAIERNRDVVRDSTLEDWLPEVTTYDAGGTEVGSEPLLGCDEVVVPSDDEAGLGTMTVLGFDAGDPTDQELLGIATSTRLAYFSADRMYLANSAVSWWGCCWEQPMWGGDVATEDWGRSRIYSFDLTGEGVSHTASGVVDGVIEDRWSMDEHDGVLRVAVGPSPETGNFSSVLTLREDGDELTEVGRVDKLGVDEEIKAVRWFDDLAVVVTFRQVDPLYAVDLSDAAAPRLLGELKIPGFSEYLHPIDDGRLIGLGQDATTDGRLIGAQAALFDVSDLTDPRRTDVVGYRHGSVAAAATDPRQFTWLPEQDTALAVVSQGWVGRTGWVSVLSVDGDRLENRMVEVDYGSDVDRVRLLPLPDGRVVLATGDAVSFFQV